MTDSLTRTADVFLGRWGTLLIGLAYFMLALSSTGGGGVGNIPGQQGLIVLTIAGSVACITSAIFCEDRMPIAHQFVGIVTMVTAATRGIAFSIKGVYGDILDNKGDLFLKYTPPWVWLLVFTLGGIIWAYGRKAVVTTTKVR